MAKRARPEQQLHMAVADYLRVVLIAPAFFSTFPSGGGGKTRGGILKGMGLMPGMPDILIFHPYPHVGHGAAPLVVGIELKAARGSQSKEQRAVEGAFRANGMNYHVCRSLEDVAAVLRKRGVPFMTTHFATRSAGPAPLGDGSAERAAGRVA